MKNKKLLFVSLSMVSTVVITGCTGGSSGASGTSLTTSSAFITSKDVKPHLSQCTVNNDGKINDCQEVKSATLSDPEGMALYVDRVIGKSYLFVSNYSTNSLTTCTLGGTDGKIANCQDAGVANLSQPEELMVTNVESKNFLIIGNKNTVKACSIIDGATLTNCNSLTTLLTSSVTGLAATTIFDNSTGYTRQVIYTTTGNPSQTEQVQKCYLNTDGTVSSCNYQAQGDFDKIKPGQIDGISINNGFAYLSSKDSNTVISCKLTDDGDITNCASAKEIKGPYELTVNQMVQSNDGQISSKAYIASYSTNTVQVCDINNQSGALENCDSSLGLDIQQPREIITSQDLGNFENIIKYPQYMIDAGGHQDSCISQIIISNNSNNQISISYPETAGGKMVKTVEIAGSTAVDPQSLTLSYVNATKDNPVIIQAKDQRDSQQLQYYSEQYMDGNNKLCRNVINKVPDNFIFNSVEPSYWVASVVGKLKFTVTGRSLFSSSSSEANALNRDSAAGALLAYEPNLFNPSGSLTMSARKLLESDGYSDFLEIRTSTINSISGVPDSLNNSSQHIITYRDEKSGGFRILSLDGQSSIPLSAGGGDSLQYDYLDGRVILAYSKKYNRVMIAYRGTDNATNAFVDIMALPMSWPTITPDSDPKIRDLLSLAKVHTGFYWYENELFNNSIVQNWIQEHKNSQVKYLVTGHSLGGAAATIGAADMLSNYAIDGDSLDLITYGQPAVGNLYFAQAYTLKNKHVLRVAAYLDPVVSATSILGYVHYGSSMWIVNPHWHFHSGDGYYEVVSALYSND